ncbi:MAG: hypothetical protein HQ581_09425 [Planctomycetes bacterium]|nr:hypothetical protein [Planctomycetota bacterium]
MFALAAQGAPQPLSSGFAPAASTGCGCGDAGCAGGCGAGACDPCCDPTWEVFADFLYLRARDAEVAYAVPINGAVIPPPGAPIQIGSTAVADFDYEPAYRAGFSGALGGCSRIGASYTFFETQTSHSTAIAPPNVIHSLVSHPGTDTASQRFLAASAEYSMDFDLIDVDFSRIVSRGQRHEISWLFGARYAGLQQDFIASFGVPNNGEVVTTDIHFDGGGIRTGLDAEWYSSNRCWLVYGRGAASFVAGEFRGFYTQDDLFGQREVYTDWTAGRVVSMLDIEIGVGWTSSDGCLRVTGGYLVSGWFNTVNTDEFINAVQTSEWAGLNDKMTFDGLVARAEVRF